METLAPNNHPLCIYGGTGMTSQNELRDRIAEVMRRAEGEWWREEDSQTDVDSHVAQAVIDGLGLEVVSDGGRPEWKLQIVGKWEEAEEQEPRP